MATIEKDLVDLLIDALNDGVPGITFDRDVLDTNRPEDWGAVEITGSDDEWADGHLIDQIIKAEIWVCLSDRGSGIRDEVQAVLAAFNETYDMTWKFEKRNYLYDLDKVMWKWAVTLWGVAGFWVTVSAGSGGSGSGGTGGTEEAEGTGETEGTGGTGVDAGDGTGAAEDGVRDDG